MDDDSTKLITNLVLLSRRLIERIYDLEASVASLRTVVARMNERDPNTAFVLLEDQWKQTQQDRGNFEEVDALIYILESGKHLDSTDS